MFKKHVQFGHLKKYCEKCARFLQEEEEHKYKEINCFY